MDFAHQTCAEEGEDYDIGRKGIAYRFQDFIKCVLNRRSVVKTAPIWEESSTLAPRNRQCQIGWIGVTIAVLSTVCCRFGSALRRQILPHEGCLVFVSKTST